MNIRRTMKRPASMRPSCIPRPSSSPPTRKPEGVKNRLTPSCPTRKLLSGYSIAATNALPVRRMEVKAHHCDDRESPDEIEFDRSIGSLHACRAEERSSWPSPFEVLSDHVPHAGWHSRPGQRTCLLRARWPRAGCRKPCCPESWRARSSRECVGLASPALFPALRIFGPEIPADRQHAVVGGHWSHQNPRQARGDERRAWRPHQQRAHVVVSRRTSRKALTQPHHARLGAIYSAHK